jgi:nitrite reductase (NADH) small subunit
MADWSAVAQLSDCPPGAALEVVADDRIVALLNVEGTIYALDGVCPHQGGPLGRGKLVGCVLTCPWHGWQFDARTGQHQLSASLVQPSFPVRVVGTTIEVDIGQPE